MHSACMAQPALGVLAPGAACSHPQENLKVLYATEAPGHSSAFGLCRSTCASWAHRSQPSRTSPAEASAVPRAMKDTDRISGLVGVSSRATNRDSIVMIGVNACGRGGSGGLAPHGPAAGRREPRQQPRAGRSS